MSARELHPQFDPYLEWLGISADRRPVTWYDLLKLGTFDADPDRLEEAYFNRYAQIRRYEGGAFGSTAIRLLDEIGAAYRGLSNPEEKLRYDEELRRASAPPVTAEIVSDTWTEIDELLQSYFQTRDSSLLRQAEELAVQADGPRGHERWAQVALAAGVESQHCEAILQSFADRNNLAVCGNCFSMVVPRERRRAMFISVNEQKDISCDVFTTETRRDWLRIWVTFRRTKVRETLGLLENPIEESCIHRRGLLTVATLAAVIPSLVGVVIGWGRGIPMGELIITLAFAYSLTILLILLIYRPRFRTGLDAIWVEFVPAMLSHSLSQVGSSFLAGLARASFPVGNRKQRRESLRAAVDTLIKSTAIQVTPEEHLAEVLRLAFRDAMGSRTDVDALLHFFRQLTDSCLKGWLSIETIDMALRDGDLFRSLQPEQLVALRLAFIRLCRSYSFSIADFVRTRRQSHALQRLFAGDIYSVVQYVTGLYGVLSARPGAVTDGWTAFELLDDQDLETLKLAENILFVSRADQICVTPRGIQFHDAEFTEPLNVAARRKRPVSSRRGNLKVEFEIVVNGRVFNAGKNPLETVERLRRTSNWYFERISPNLSKEALGASLAQAVSPPVASWLDRNSVVCRQCRRKVIFVRGQIGEIVPSSGQANRPS